MAFQKKYLFGFSPFWPTYPIGYFIRVLAQEFPRVLRGHSGRMYFKQFHMGRWRILRQVPRAVILAFRDEVKNIWRARYNNRVL